MEEKAIEVLNIFNEYGYEAYIVGGYVRDKILGKNSSDIDICTNATPKEIKDIFNDAILPHERYGAINLVYRKVNFEITTYRMDLEYQNSRTPSKIMYTNKLIIDLKRRDFTMNTLCIDKNGKVLDLLNNKQDINNKIIKTVGNADRRIKEDSLRILRAIRFASELNFTLDRDLENAIISNRNLLSNLSYFRKKQELNRIFSSNYSLYGLKLIKDFGLEEFLDIKIDDNIVKTSDPIGMWVQVNQSDKYQFTNNELKYIKSIKEVIKNREITDLELYYEGNYVCYIAAQILGINEAIIYDRYDKLPIKRPSDINISVNEIIDIINIKDKSKIKIVIKDLENQIINGKLINNYDIIKKYLIQKY